MNLSKKERPEFNIIISNKYRFYTKPNDHRVYCDRGDEKEWIVFEKGSKAIIGLLYKILEQQDEIRVLEEIIDEAEGFTCMDTQ